MKPYPKYKDSGVEWLGEVPEHWRTKPIKYISTCNDETIPDTTNPDYQIEYVEISNVNYGAGITETTHIPFSEAPSRARRKVNHGDIIISTVRTYLKAISPIKNPPDNMIVSTGFAVIRPHNVNSKFIGYVLQSEFLLANIISRSEGISYPAINSSELIKLKVPIPSSSEQDNISVYLDRETTRIDSLIKEKENFISLLKEKRQALISHAVTKGLDPTVKMKDSGVEWIGEVPESWIHLPLKWISKTFAGGTPDKKITEYWENGVIPWINSGAVNNDLINQPTTYITEDAFRNSSAKWIKNGSLVMALAGQGKTKGMAAQLNIDTTCNQSMAAIEVNHNYNARFLYWWLKSNYQNIRNLSGGDSRDGLNLEIIGLIRCPFFYAEEQKSIADYLDSQTTKIDELVKETQNSIELLKEHRTTLISAAVTGKIDVREVA